MAPLGQLRRKQCPLYLQSALQRFHVHRTRLTPAPEAGHGADPRRLAQCHARPRHAHRRLRRVFRGEIASRDQQVVEARNQHSVENEQLTVGVERKAPTRSVRDRSPLALLMEGALLRELQSSRLNLVDPTLAERTLAARGHGGDTEFDSLHGAASYLLEVELVPGADSVSLIGSLKGLRNSDIIASVRQPVEHDLRNPADIDALARVFVRRLLGVPATSR